MDVKVLGPGCGNRRVDGRSGGFAPGTRVHP
jgi:hypothetical protein